jgi:hypothetical protein
MMRVHLLEPLHQLAVPEQAPPLESRFVVAVLRALRRFQVQTMQKRSRRNWTLVGFQFAEDCHSKFESVNL